MTLGRRLWSLGVMMAFCCVFVLVSGPRSWAQFATTATISGTVHDPSGAAIPGAKVIATNTGTGTQTTTQTDNSGSFVFSSLQVGTYTVTVSKSGFQTYSTTGVALHPGIVSNVMVTMRIGSVATHVTVSGAVVQVQTSTSEISSQVSARQVSTLPLNGRNYQSLAALMPGVTNTSPGQSLNQGGFLTSNVMSINGMGHSGTLYTLDGTWNMNTGNMTQTTITPNPDTIQEVRVLQNNYGARYSLFGANVVLLETKSGTSTFHGSAFEYLRNDALDARNFFSPTVSPLKQNIFGYTLGGPFYIPHHFNKNKQKVFFFWSQQFVRQHIASAYTAADPTLAMRNGLFSDPITDPTTGQLFPQNASGQYVIPQSRINQSSLALLNAIAPLPNNPSGGFLNYINNTPGINTQRDDEAKGDYNLTSKLRLMAEYLDERQLNGNPRDTFLSSPYETSTDPIQTKNQLAQIRLTQMLSSTMVNTTAIAMNNYVVNLAIAGIAQRSQVPGFKEVLPYEGGWQSNRLPQLDFSGGYPSLGVPQSLPLDHASDLEDTFSDDWSWLHGNHYIQAGMNIVLGTKRQTAYAFSNGDWGFNGQFTGDPIADYLLGLPNSLFQQSTAVRPYMHYKIVSPYIQDQWKATNKLTLTGGLRIFYLPFDHAQRGFTAAFDPATYDPAKAPIVNNDGTITPTANYDPTNGLVYNGINGTPLNLSNGDHNWQLGPQFGFAYDVFGNGKTSLRGGYGITYTRVMARCSYSCTKNPPLVKSLTLVNPDFPNPLGTGSVVPAGAPTLVSQDLNAYPAARLQSYSLSLEHQFASNWIVSLAEAGNIGHHVLFESWNRNQPLPDPPYDFNPALNSGNVSAAVYAPYQGYNTISTSVSDGNLSWNALEFGMRHPVGHNLFLSVAYTWQHGLADERTTSFFEGSSPQNVYNLRADWGNSQVNAAQILAISDIWTIPWYKNASGFKGAILGGWKYSGITSFMSGFATDPGLSISNPGLATRPNRISNDVTGPKTVAEWFNTAAFAAPAAGYFGNAGTGIITGPGLINFDMAFYKSFKVTERATVDFRSELFNIFNHTNFAGISTGYGSGNFGQVTSARDPRIVEFALRVHF